jgi:hypothetical protein
MAAGRERNWRVWSGVVRLLREGVSLSLCTLAMVTMTLTPGGVRALRALAGLDGDPGLRTDG